MAEAYAVLQFLALIQATVEEKIIKEVNGIFSIISLNKYASDVKLTSTILLNSSSLISLESSIHLPDKK